MKNLNVLAVKAAGSISLALLLTTSAFADSRPQDETNRREGRVDRSRVEQRSNESARGTENHSGTPSEAYRNGGQDRSAGQDRNGGQDRNRGTYDANRNRGSYDGNRDNGSYRNNGATEQRRDSATSEAYRNGGRNDGYRGNDRGHTESRPSYGSSSRNYGYRGSYHEHDRAYLRGSISRYVPEHNGYRVYVGYDSFWVPAAYWRSHGWRVGLSINLGGIFRGGAVWIDDVPYGYGGYYGADPYGYYNDGYYGGGYSDGYVRGRVDRIDFRTGTLLMRDDRDGRIVEVDMRGDRYGRLNLDDIRPGDYIELSGNWVRGDIFQAYRVESVRTGGGYGRY